MPAATNQEPKSERLRGTLGSLQGRQVGEARSVVESGSVAYSKNRSQLLRGIVAGLKTASMDFSLWVARRRSRRGVRGPFRPVLAAGCQTQ